MSGRVRCVVAVLALSVACRAGAFASELVSRDDAAVSSIVKTKLPRAVLRSIVGCWVDRRAKGDRYTFSRTADGGAQVVRRILHDPSLRGRDTSAHEIMYDTHDGRLAFAAVGRIHPLLFVFKAERGRLAGSWFSKHDQRGYFFTGSNSTLIPCP